MWPVPCGLPCQVRGSAVKAAYYAFDVGVVPEIDRTGADLGVNLAISLHAVRDELRNDLVPINRKYPLDVLIEACRNYPGLSNARRITWEYVMLDGVNAVMKMRGP